MNIYIYIYIYTHIYIYTYTYTYENVGIEAITSRVQGSEKTLTNDTAMAAAAEEAVCDDGKGIVSSSRAYYVSK